MIYTKSQRNDYDQWRSEDNFSNTKILVEIYKMFSFMNYVSFKNVKNNDYIVTDK